MKVYLNGAEKHVNKDDLIKKFREMPFGNTAVTRNWSLIVSLSIQAQTIQVDDQLCQFTFMDGMIPELEGVTLDKIDKAFITVLEEM